MEVNIIYHNDKTGSKLNHVPGSCTIKTLKAVIAKINKMDSPDPIKLIYQGRILQNEDTFHKILGELPPSISIHAVGVTRPERRPVPEIPKPNQEIPAMDIPDGKDKIDGCVMTLSIIIGMFVGLSVASLLIDPATYGVKDDTLKLEVTTKAAITGIVLIFGVLLVLIALFNRVCSLFQGSFWVSVREFFLSMMPFWDAKKFLNDHGLENFDQVDDPAFGKQ